MSPLRGIFFDLDDTLIGYAEAERSALLAGCTLAARARPAGDGRPGGDGRPAIDPDTLAEAIYEAYARRYAYGTPGYGELATLSVTDFRRLLTEDALRSFGIADPDLTEALIAAYARAEAQALTAFPDAETTLRRLRPHFRVGLITNGPAAMQRSKLAALALDGYFEVIVVDTEFGHPKPDARIFRHAAALVGLDPAELLFVGNSLAHDVAGARAAGWTSVWLNPEGAPPADAPEAAMPDHVICRLEDLLNLPRVAEALAPSATVAPQATLAPQADERRLRTLAR